jgi:hypothetical protein
MRVLDLDMTVPPFDVVVKYRNVPKRRTNNGSANGQSDSGYTGTALVLEK